MAKRDDTGYFTRLLQGFITEEDPLLAMLNWMTQRLMQIEAESKVGVEKGKHSAKRSTHFSGTRVRRFDTRLGTMYLLVPKVRKGGYIPFFVSERKRSEQALIQVIHEAFLNGISTRKIERVAKRLGIENISAGQVSQINKELNDQVELFQNRPLSQEYPVLWVDAMYEKIRDDGCVVSMAVLIVYGVTLEGQREILSVTPMYDESEGTWTATFNQLKSRGLERVWLVVSDAHPGIEKAVTRSFTGCSWQRCKVHFMRNILARVRHSDKAVFAERLKQIWLQPTREAAIRVSQILIEDYQDRYPDAIRCLEDGLEDSLQFYAFELFDKRKIASTNVLERLIREIRRRTRVIGIFPSSESYLRLVTCCLIEYTEDWMSDRCYISKQTISHRKELLAVTA